MSASLKSHEERKDRDSSPPPMSKRSESQQQQQQRSPLGSPSRSLLSRAHNAHSPSTTLQPSPTVMAAQAAAIRASPLQGSTVAIPASSASSSLSLGAGPSIRTIEAANHHEPYALGSRDVTLPNKYLRDEGCAKVMHELLGRGADLSVQSLDLRGNDIRRYGAEAIGELLRENTTVESLNLEWNFLGDSGGSGLEVLCDALKTNKTLQSLNLRNNRLNSECGLSLARLLTVNRTIQSIDLRWNNLGAPGGSAIAEALVRNHHVRHLMLSGNRIPSSTLKAIEEALAKNREVGLLCGKVAPKEDAERIMISEATIADLHSQLSKLQGSLARTEQELQDEKRRCDELTDALASLRDKSASAKLAANKQVADLQLDLDRVQHELFECQRRGDANGLELKAAQAQIIKLTSELSMAQEDRSRLLLSRESSSATLQSQLEQARGDWNRLNEAAHAKESAWESERGEFEAKLAHLRRIGESEKELAVTSERDRNRALAAEMARMKEDHSSQVSELHARLKSIQDSSGDSSSTVLSLRESLVRQAITHEEALAKLEAQYRSEGASSHANTLAAFEERLRAIESARDELAQSGEAQKTQYSQLLSQLSKERAEHMEALEKERGARSELAKQSAAALAESYALKARLQDQEHRLALAASQHEASAAALQDQARRHQEQVEQVYAQARAEARATERALRSEQDERVRLAQKVRTLEAEQTLRSQNLATALSALKSSVSVVDQNVQRDFAKSDASSGGGSTHHHHRSDRERGHAEYESSSLSPRREHTSDRDRDRDHRDRERSVPSSPSHAHRSSSGHHHSSHREGSSSGRHHHHSHHSSSNSRRDSGSAPSGSGAAPSSSSSRRAADPESHPAPTLRTHSTPVGTTSSAPSSRPSSAATARQVAAAAPLHPQRRQADASDPEGSALSFDEAQHGASQPASRIVSASQSYSQQPNDEDVEVDFED